MNSIVIYLRNPIQLVGECSFLFSVYTLYDRTILGAVWVPLSDVSIDETLLEEKLELHVRFLSTLLSNFMYDSITSSDI